MEYKSVSEANGTSLDAAVNTLIADGWVPLGGVSVAVIRSTWENKRKGYEESETVWVYAQALTRSNAVVRPPSEDSAEQAPPISVAP